MSYYKRPYYRKMVPKKVLGYVVNIFNPVSFDIDFQIDREIHENYKNVIKNTYTYSDKKINQEIFSEEKKGLSYRCRIKGIRKLHENRTYNYNLSMAQIHQFVNENEGWVKVTISDIDPHRRILVQIEATEEKSTYKNISEILLNEKEKLFQSYTKIERNSLSN